jgi:hypothetical protein
MRVRKDSSRQLLQSGEIVIDAQIDSPSWVGTAAGEHQAGSAYNRGLRRV